MKRPDRSLSDYRLFIFDLDGTVVSSEQVMRWALARCHQRSGRSDPVPYERFFARMGAPLERIFEELGLAPELMQEYRSTCMAHLDQVETYPELVDVVHLLAARGHAVALFTGKDRARTIELLKARGLYELFDCVVTADDVVHGKPHPEGVLKILRDLDTPASRAIVIGDSAYDIESAHRAGLDAAYAMWGTGDERAVARLAPRWHFRTPAELKHALSVAQPTRQMSGPVYALDIGGSKVEAVRLFDERLECARMGFAPHAPLTEDMRALEPWLEALTAPRAGSTVVTSFAGVTRDGIVIKWPNRPDWEGVDLRRLLKKTLNVERVILEDDANMGALASHVLFAETSSSIYVNAGTGIGCGIVLDGTLYRGGNGFAGELGHTVVEPDSPLRCGCGKRGCLQLFASGRGILEQLRERDVRFAEYESLEAVLAASGGAEAAGAILFEGARRLGLAIANLVCLLDVTRIHVSGSLCHEPRFTRILAETLGAAERDFLNRPLDLRIGASRNLSLVGALLEAARKARLTARERRALEDYLAAERSPHTGLEPCVGVEP